MVHQQDIAGIVKTAALRQQPCFGQYLLSVLIACFADQNLMCLFVNPVVAGAFLFLRTNEQRRNLIHAYIEIGVILGLSGNDQRRTRFVDQDRIDLVDDGVGKFALHTLIGAINHVVAQIIKAEFVVGAVGNVTGERCLLVGMRHLRQIDAYGQPQETVQLAHPLGVALRQIVIDGNKMHALAGQCIEIGRQRGYQRFAFASTHFGNFSMVKHHAADQLHIEVTHAQRALPGLADDGKRLRQQSIKRFAVGKPVFELIRLRTQCFIGKRGKTSFQRIDLANDCHVLPDQPVITAAENLFEYAGNHRSFFGRRKIVILACRATQPYPAPYANIGM